RSNGVGVRETTHQRGNGDHDFVVAIHPVHVGSEWREYADDAKGHGADPDLRIEGIVMREERASDGLADDGDPRGGGDRRGIEVLTAADRTRPDAVASFGLAQDPHRGG